MSIRVDSSSWITGAIVVGHRGLGILAEDIPAAGDNGPSFLFNDVSLPADSGKEICGSITAWPSAGSLYAYEDGSFEFSGAPDGAYSFAYQLKVDGVDVGSPTTVYLQVGSPSAQFLATTDSPSVSISAKASPLGDFSVTTDDAIAAFGAAVGNGGAFSITTSGATFSGGALVAPFAVVSAVTESAVFSGGAAVSSGVGLTLTADDIAAITQAMIAALGSTTINVNIVGSSGPSAEQIAAALMAHPDMLTIKKFMALE